MPGTPRRNTDFGQFVRKIQLRVSLAVHIFIFGVDFMTKIHKLFYLFFQILSKQVSYPDNANNKTVTTCPKTQTLVTYSFEVAASTWQPTDM